MQVEEIHFDHQLGDLAYGALSLRANGKRDSEIVPPEWSADGRREPVGFAANALTSTIRILAAFSGGTPQSRVAIRARRDSGVLGDVGRTTVHLDTNGSSGLVALDLSADAIRRSGVGEYPSTLRWQFNEGTRWQGCSTGDPKGLGRTHHKIFVTLAPPTWPWSGTLKRGRRRPWVTALEVACDWCQGLQSFDAISERITFQVNQHPRAMYDYFSFFGIDEFHLHDYLTKVSGGTRVFLMNCTDAANAVVTLANLLGCDLSVARVTFDRRTRPVLPIGRRGWSPERLDHHEVAWRGAAGFESRVYDACLQVDLDDEDADRVHVAGLVVNRRLGPSTGSKPDDYRRLLAGQHELWLESKFTRVPPAEEPS